ncbi:uncharacterized protein LOC134559145 [Prinia subflava]|uniref:uncharacterized protein LOC134559145 n=1 Tax=Prinia subflava TaxID=208062 RepID=UPI002FE011C2
MCHHLPHGHCHGPFSGLLFLGLLFPCPVMQRGLDPRGGIPEDRSQGRASRGWIPEDGSQGLDPRGWIPGAQSQRMDPRDGLPGAESQYVDPRALCSAAHPFCRRHSSLFLGRSRGPGRGSAKAAGSLQHLPCFWVPVAVVTLGQGSGLAWPWLVQRQPKPLFLSNGCCNLGAPQGSFLPSFPPENKGQQRGSPAQWFLLGSQLGARGRGAGPDAGAPSRDAASASHQAAGAAGAVIDGLFISLSPAQDVSVRLRKIFLGSAAPSILPRLLLPPGSSLSRPGGLKPVQTQGTRSKELPSHSPWVLPVGRAGLGSASLGMDQAKV